MLRKIEPGPIRPIRVFVNRYGAFVEYLWNGRRRIRAVVQSCSS